MSITATKTRRKPLERQLVEFDEGQEISPLPNYVLKDIEEGKRQLDAGLGIPHEIVMQRLRRCRIEK